MNPTGTEARVCADIASRQAKGIAKYGTTVEGNPLSLKEWLQHAYEESLDRSIYLKRAIEEIEKTEQPEFQPCDECRNFIAWVGNGEPPPDHNPCAKRHTLLYRPPSNMGDAYDEGGWGFNLPNCPDRLEK